MDAVSVVIPTKDRPEKLEVAVKSVIEQNFNGIIEIIIIDDSKLVFPLASNDPMRPIIHIPGKLKGAPNARNMGFSKSSGDFICFLDDDDTWDKEKVAKQMELMETYPDCPLCICYSHDLRFGGDRISKPPNVVTHRMTIKSFNLSSTSSYMVRKDRAKAIIDLEGYLFDETLLSGQEYDLAIRLSKYFGDIRTVPEVLMTQNETEGQISQTPKKKVKGIFQLFVKHKSDYKLIDYIKTFGIISLFLLSYIIGTKVYSIITPIKEVYEA